MRSVNISNNSQHNKIGLISVIAIGIGTIIGSGWLFAPYFAAKTAGPASLLSWLFAALIYIFMALCLAEIATMYPQRGLFTRLLALSHNKDFGYVTALSNWLGAIIIIPSEAEATIQYLSTIYPRITPYIFFKQQLTLGGLLLTAIFMFSYGVINYWGIRSLAKFNNVITFLKVLIPVFVAIIFMITIFHPSNFTIYQQTWVPYGTSSIFVAIVNSGIFYAFFGFQLVVSFASELKKPKKNIPIALISCISICLLIYLLLQTAYIGSLPPHLISNGWHKILFTSPLAELAGLVGLNYIAIILYADACLSPSGTGIVYLGASTRMLTAMSQEKQMPKFFDKLHPVFHFSRRSLIFTLFCCCILIIFFRSWQQIMLIITAFQLLSCIAIPIAFTKLRQSQPHIKREFYLGAGKIISLFIFYVLTFFLMNVDSVDITITVGLHICFFAIYGLVSNNYKMNELFKSLRSSWTIFVYMFYLVVITYLKKYGVFSGNALPGFFITIFVLTGLFYYLMINQKNYHKPTTK